MSWYAGESEQTPVVLLNVLLKENKALKYWRQESRGKNDVLPIYKKGLNGEKQTKHIKCDIP